MSKVKNQWQEAYGSTVEWKKGSLYSHDEELLYLLTKLSYLLDVPLNQFESPHNHNVGTLDISANLPDKEVRSTADWFPTTAKHYTVVERKLLSLRHKL